MSLQSLIQYCIKPPTPKLFVARLKEYAADQRITLQQAAESLLPFTQLYNRIQFTTILACILNRQELITPAAKSFVYQQGFLEVESAYPELELNRHLELVKTPYRLTQSIVDMVDSAAFTHLLLSHCGLAAEDTNDRMLNRFLKLGEDKSFLLEEHVARAGLPQAFHTTAQTIGIRTLSLKHLERFVALTIAAKQYRQYLEFELDLLIRHLQPEGDAAKTVMHLLASHPKKVAEAAMYVRTSDSLSQFCYQNGWQVGFAFRAMNKLRYDLLPPFTQAIHLQQAFHFIISAVVLSLPVTTFNVSENDLNAVLNRVLQEPLILLNYPVVGAFRQILAQQQSQPFKYQLTVEQLQFLNTAIAKDFRRFYLESLRAMVPSIGSALINNRDLLLLALFVMAIGDAFQFFAQYRSVNMMEVSGNCDEIKFISQFNYCLSCQFSSAKLYEFASVPKEWIAENWELSWLDRIVRYNQNPCVSRYDLSDCNHYPPFQKDGIPSTVVCSSGPESSPFYCLPECRDLNNTLLATQFEQFYGFVYNWDYIASDLPPQDNTQPSFVASINIVIGLMYLLLLVSLIIRLIQSSLVHMRYPNRETIHAIVEKMKLFLNLQDNTHHQANQFQLTRRVQELETMNIVSIGPTRFNTMLLQMLLTHFEFMNHPLQQELQLGTADVTVAQINQAKISHLISQTMWHYEQENRLPAPENRFAGEEFYYV